MILNQQIKPIISAVLLTLLLITVPVAPIQAQDEILIENMQVSIWPEYDRPSLLIIYHISLSPQTSLPASLSLRIPADAGRPHAVAMQDPAGLYNLDYEMSAAGDWIEINFTTPMPDVRLEYYDPQIDTNQPERNFTFRWPGDYDVENLSLQIQQPPTATNMVFKPVLGSGRPGNDGLTYYNYVVGQVDAETTFELVVSYDKPDDQLTSANQFQPVQPQDPVNLATARRITIDQVLPWALGGLSLLLISVGGIWLWRTGRPPQPSQTRPRHARKEGQPAQANGEAIFCRQCGKKAGQGDLFCRACGTKL